MCLIVFSYEDHAAYPLIFAGNRDEFYARPAAAASFWEEQPRLLAGRDLKAGGTWCGVDRSGRFAVITNYREPGVYEPAAPSRGRLVLDYIAYPGSLSDFLRNLEQEASRYNGFSFLGGHFAPVANGVNADLRYFSNRSAPQTAGPGVHGLSNASLDTPWPKVRRARELFRQIVARSDDDVSTEDLLSVLHDEQKASDDELPDTGLFRKLERAVSSIFIRGDEYGTRASTVVMIDRHGTVTFVERSFGPGGHELGTREFVFSICED